MDAIIVRRNPTGELSVVEPMFREIDRFAGDLWDSWTPTLIHEHGTGIPLDLVEMKDEMVLRAELPGFRKEDIDISLEGDELTLKATRKDVEQPEGTKTYLSEICYGEYSRMITLPYPVNTEKVVASFKNGMLEIKLPKTEESKPKHIEVQIK
jgi:HSP20 family protein